MLDSHMFLRIDAAYLPQRGHRGDRIDAGESRIPPEQLVRLPAQVGFVIANVAEPTRSGKCDSFQIADLRIQLFSVNTPAKAAAQVVLLECDALHQGSRNPSGVVSEPHAVNILVFRGQGKAKGAHGNQSNLVRSGLP